MFKRCRFPLMVILLAGLLVGLAACSPGETGSSEAGSSETGDPTAAPAEEDAGAAGREVMPGWREDRLAQGKATYESACASCHEAGEGGAPRPGRREDWSDRSDMWQAVLFNHAKSGYLQMPGKGGQPELSDAAVEAAAEYMLGLTFPEKPLD
ncbi:MAG: c-type cytochrome [Xanthomonadales bacterium]|jgi:cytochrome c5|nr:c-type cytochrome [Xanthomonadales bacterium]